MGTVQVVPLVEVDTTTRASPIRGSGRIAARPRVDHARYARPAPSNVMVGNPFVRNEVFEMPWSKGLTVATTVGAVNEVPPSVERTVTIASPITPSLN